MFVICHVLYVQQVQIHTGFHRFTEIHHMFQKKVFNNKLYMKTSQVENWKMV